MGYKEGRRMLTVANYEVIRRWVLVEGLSQREVATELGHSRKTVRKALGHSAPPGYQRKKKPRLPVIEPVRGFIDAWLAQDVEAPRKQRHTAQRIYERLKAEHAFKGSASAVRRYVAWKLAKRQEVFYPLVFDAGEEAQVDWGEAWCLLSGVMTKVHLFCMRLAHSTASYVRAYVRENQESLLDGHVRAYAFFGGVPRRQAYDNLKTAVITVSRGRERVLTAKFLELRSHYLFESRFCNVASGNEKGHVENLVKWAQSRFMTPIPAVTGMEELNAHLQAECEQDLDRAVVARQGRTVRDLLTEERAQLLPLPRDAYAACRNESTFATKQALVRFDGNDYSAPVAWAYHAVQVRGYVDRIDICAGAERIAEHVRSYGSGEYVLDWMHYLPLLERKPGGIHNARPFKGEPWGEDFARMQKELVYRYESAGWKKFVNILLLLTKHPVECVKDAVSECVKKCVFSDEAVRGMIEYVAPQRPAAIDLSGRPELAEVGSGVRPANTYDVLLARAERKGVPA
jgi:transposase